MYVRIYLYVCIYMYVCMYIHVCIQYVYTCMYSMYMYVCIMYVLYECCMYVCMYVCKCTCMYVCIYIIMYVYVYVLYMYCINICMYVLCIPYSRKYWRNKTLAVSPRNGKFKVYGVNFNSLLLKFMCGCGLLNRCTCASTFDTTSYIRALGHHIYKNVWTPTLRMNWSAEEKETMILIDML